MNADEKNKQLDELKKRNQEEYRKFRAAINNIAKLPDGEIVLRHIAKLSGFFKSSIVLKGGMGTMNGVDTEGTIANEGRRGLYLDIRRPMSEETRRLIESKPQEEDNV
jgi:hypothetical protein